jgi:hypothetical protein
MFLSTNSGIWIGVYTRGGIRCLYTRGGIRCLCVSEVGSGVYVIYQRRDQMSVCTRGEIRCLCHIPEVGSGVWIYQTDGIRCVCIPEVG